MVLMNSPPPIRNQCKWRIQEPKLETWRILVQVIQHPVLSTWTKLLTRFYIFLQNIDLKPFVRQMQKSFDLSLRNSFPSGGEYRYTYPIYLLYLVIIFFAPFARTRARQLWWTFTFFHFRKWVRPLLWGQGGCGREAVLICWLRHLLAVTCGEFERGTIWAHRGLTRGNSRNWLAGSIELVVMM